MKTHSKISSICRATSEIFENDFGLMLQEDTFMDLWFLHSYVRNFPKRFGTYATSVHIHGSLVFAQPFQAFSQTIWNLWYMRTHSRISGLPRVMSGIFPKDSELMLLANTFMDLWSLQSYDRHFSKTIWN